MRTNILTREGPGLAEFQLSPGEGKKQCIHVLHGVTSLWSRGSSGLHAHHTHCFTPMFPTLESSWTKPLHEVIAWPAHPLFLNCYGGRKLFCLGSSFYHKMQGFFGKEKLFFGKEPAVNLTYTLWNTHSAEKGRSKCNITISNAVWLWGNYKEAKKKGCLCSGCRNANFTFTLSFV